MKITPIASSSDGNAYLVEDAETRLLLDCGVSFRRLTQALDHKVSSVLACLVTHEHKDHCKAVVNLQQAGVEVYASRGTWEAMEADVRLHHRARIIVEREELRIGSFRVVPFGTIHDAREPLGFYLGTGAERLLYMTDSAYCKHRFAGMTHIAIECNWVASLMRERVERGELDPRLNNRVIRNHMGLDRVLEFMRRNDLSRVREIHLLHLSDGNADADRMRNAVEIETGKPVYVAERYSPGFWRRD